jgi:hypothetical protein
MNSDVLSATAMATLDLIIDSNHSLDGLDEQNSLLVSWTNNPTNKVVKMVFSFPSFDGTSCHTGVRINTKLVNLLAEKASLRSFLSLLSRSNDLEATIDYITKRLVK